MVDSIRFHDGSPYDLGYEAGFYWRDQHQPPTCPFRSRSRAAVRWHRGFRAGCSANDRRLEILIDRARIASGREQEKALRALGVRQAKAAERFGRPNP